MPIKPDYDWTETEYVLTVQVHMKGFERARADVSATGMSIFHILSCFASLPLIYPL